MHKPERLFEIAQCVFDVACRFFLRIFLSAVRDNGDVERVF